MSPFAVPKPIKRAVASTTPVEATKPEVVEESSNAGDVISTSNSVTEKSTTPAPLPSTSSNAAPTPQLDYNPPEWIGTPKDSFSLLVLKEGVVCEETPLAGRSYWLVGRVPGCHIVTLHPSVSRYHAIIEFKSNGLSYIYDLNSTHHTTINKRQIPPRKHIELRPGDHVRFGESTRTHILQGPDIRARLKEEAEARLQEQKKQEQKIESTGVTWGFSEDVTDDGGIIRAAMESGSDATKASYHEDPKKALRHYMEHRGYAMEFEMQDEFEHGFHTFTARIQLPIHDEDGAVVWASGSAGRKKDAERVASLDAMEKLDAHGELDTRNAQQGFGSKKRFKRILKDNDGGDSDDDTFYDRTGTREKRKAKQMRVKQKPVDNYESLLEKRQQVEERIESLKQQLNNMSIAKSSSESNNNNNEDDLDAYMAGVQTSIEEKEANRLQKEISTLQKEIERLNPLIEFTRPTDLPINTLNLTNPLMDDDISDEIPPIRRSTEDQTVEWIPPKDQSGDGRTSLNDKYGY
ncbi:hypothetical protein BDF19DRAFT_447889 [Syncephalis fuscata]|nr:hypothetical protein BDF19DRAFT_447889 [Syncephalis fuscata]